MFENYKEAVDSLVYRGEAIRFAMLFKYSAKDELEQLDAKTLDGLKRASKEAGDITDAYHAWYSEALAAIKQLLPDRLNDFVSFYKPESKRKEISFSNYSIEDALAGLRVTNSYTGEEKVGPSAALSSMGQQVAIVSALKSRLEGVLFDIRTLVQADLFDDELAAATELSKKGFGRAACALAGVVLETHLSQVCVSHKVAITKKKPTVADYNNALKEKEVIDTPTWRKNQYLADIRNKADHKGKDPTQEEVKDLITGVEKVTKTLF